MYLSVPPGSNKLSSGIDLNNITTPHPNDTEGVTYALNRDAVGNPNCPDYPPLQRYSLDQVPDFPACSDLCPNPDPALTPNFAAYYVSACADPATVDAIAIDALVGQEIYLEILDLDPSVSYQWFIEGDWAIDNVFVPDDYSYFTLHWNAAGLYVITLNADDGTYCSARQYTLTIHEGLDCLMPEPPIAALTQPTDCATGTGAIDFTIPTTGSGCYSFGLYSLAQDPAILLYESSLSGSFYEGLAPGAYYAYMQDSQTGCYSESHFDINTHSIAPQALSACGGGLGSIHLNISHPNDYTYAWSNGNTAPSLVNVAAGNYSVTVTAIGGCSASASAVLAADATPCFVDLRMRDNWNDIGEEPNTSSYQDDNGDGWLAYGSDDDWEDIWASPDLWNCPSGNDCPAWEWSNPTAAAYNKIGFSVYNSHPSLASEPATLHLYYSLANTGEVWESDWVNNNYEAEGYTCTVGNQIGTVVIPAIPANGIHEGWHEWTPPNFINNMLNDYVSADACGLITEIDPIDETAKYEVCLLARLESVNDPINGEQGNGTPIRDNVLNSNNIVTRNTFLIDPNIGGSPGESIIGHPSIILVMNNNDDVQHLDVLFDKISGGSTEALDNLVEISWVLSPDLWAKWESTGKQGEGIEEIGEREVKITDMETAKLLNLPFDPREFQPLAIKVTILTSSGKRETLNYLPDEFGFRITHRSSDGSPINQPSNCYFTLKDLPQLAQTAYLVSEQLVCSPNPFSSSMNVQFYLAKAEAVTLGLYDLQGRLVKTIQPNEVVAAGTHNFAVDSQNLPNGVYICSLITESRQLNEKVVLVR